MAEEKYDEISKQYKNEKPAVPELDVHNQANGAVLKRSKDGKFTHNKQAEKSYNKNEKKWSSLSEEKRNSMVKERESKRDVVDKVSSYLFLKRKNDVIKFIYNNYKFLKKYGAEKFTFRENKNIFTDKFNKVDYILTIFDGNNEKIGDIFIDFKHKNSLMGKSSSILSGSTMDFSIGKWSPDGKKMEGSFNSRNDMCDFICYGLIDSNKTLSEFKKSPYKVENLKMSMAIINKRQLKDNYISRIFKTKKRNVNSILDDEATSIYNVYKEYGFEKLEEMTNNGDPILSQLGDVKCFSKIGKNGKKIYSLQKDIDENCSIELKISQGNVNVNLNISTSSLTESGFLKEIK